MQKLAIITAGGSGNRLGGDKPKQFLDLGGKPLLFHSLEKFYHIDPQITLLISIPEKFFSYWEQLTQKYPLNVPHKIVPGGPARFHSVQNALLRIQENNGLVAIHDAARPLASTKLIEATYREAAAHDSAIPVVPITDSIRQKQGDQWKAANRKNFCSVQTPQTFNLLQIKKAYSRDFEDKFTDDAMVYEKMYEKIHMINGEPENIKITTKQNLLTARYYFQNLHSSMKNSK